MLYNYFFMFAFSLVLGIIVTKLLKNLSIRYKIIFVKGIPHIGGVSMGLLLLIVSFITLFIVKGSQKLILGILIPSLVMLIFGIIDDKTELSVGRKFLGQLIAASLLVAFGIKTQIVYIGNIPNILITLIWIIGITNAFNHLDILDGLAGGMTLIITAAFFVIAVFNHNATFSLLTSGLIGIVLSFLIFNIPPAKIYMGNSGSHFLGFLLGAIALVMDYAPMEKKIALLCPLLILGFPIFDTAFVTLMRLRKGRSILKKSNDHLALRFLKLGLSKERTLSYILIMVVFFTVCGILLNRLSNFMSYIIVCIVLFISILLTVKMSAVAVDD